MYTLESLASHAKFLYRLIYVGICMYTSSLDKIYICLEVCIILVEFKF